MRYFMRQNENNKGAIEADARLKHCDAEFILIHCDILPFKPRKTQLLLFIPGYADFNLTVPS